MSSPSPDPARSNIGLALDRVNDYIVRVTMWTPALSQSSGPLYLALADAIAADVAAHNLAPGTRLPTHRELAETLGVTVGTVSRGYAEANRRGLVSGEVGRGTFVTSGVPAP